MRAGIYTIVNVNDGKCYVGSAMNFVNRYAKHLRDLKNGKHHSPRLQNAWNKYGAESFQFRKLLICSSKDLIFYEQRCIDALRPDYNIARIAGSSIGIIRTLETRLKVRASKLGRTLTPEHRAKIGASSKGHTVSPETRVKIGAVHRWKIVAPETRAKLRAAKLGKEQHSDEERQIRRERLMGNKYGLGNKTWVGRKHSPETCAKMTAWQVGRKLSPEHRANIAAGLKRRAALERQPPGDKP